MKPTAPPRSTEAHTEPFRCDKYTSKPPPAASPRVAYWLTRIASGWRPNRRISLMRHHKAAEFFGVYVWEYANVIAKAIEAAKATRVETAPRVT